MTSGACMAAVNQVASSATDFERLRRREHPEPDLHLVVVVAQLRDGRQIGQEFDALLRCCGKRMQLARLHQLDHLRIVLQHGGHVPAEQVVDGRNTAGIGHVDEVDVGHAFEQLDPDVLGCAGTNSGK